MRGNGHCPVLARNLASPHLDLPRAHASCRVFHCRSRSAGARGGTRRINGCSCGVCRRLERGSLAPGEQPVDADLCAEPPKLSELRGPLRRLAETRVRLVGRSSCTADELSDARVGCLREHMQARHFECAAHARQQGPRSRLARPIASRGDPSTHRAYGAATTALSFRCLVRTSLAWRSGLFTAGGVKRRRSQQPRVHEGRAVEPSDRKGQQSSLQPVSDGTELRRRLVEALAMEPNAKHAPRRFRHSRHLYARPPSSRAREAGTPPPNHAPPSRPRPYLSDRVNG